MKLTSKHLLKLNNQYNRLLFLNVFLITVLVGILTRMYFVFSRNGMWLDIDTSRMTQYILTVYKSGNIHGGPMYSNGFLYPIVASIHSMILGVDVFSYQFLIHPFFSLLLIFPAYALARQVFNPQHNHSTLNILLYGYILLNCSSVFIFRTSRGGHTLFTYMFIILYLSLLFAPNSGISPTKKKFLMVILFFAVTSSNVYFGTVLLYTVVSYWIFRKITNNESSIKLNSTDITTYLTLLLFVIFVIYPSSSINYVNIMYLAFYKLEKFIQGLSSFSSPYTEYLSLWNSQIIYILLFQSDLVIAGLSLIFVLYLFLKKKIQHLTADSSVVVYFSLTALVVITVLLDKLGIGFGSNFGFRVFGLLLIVSSLIFLRLSNIMIKHYKISILILLLWLIISPITATIKATTPPFVSGYINSYSLISAYSIKWLNQKTTPPEYISTIDEFQPKNYLKNLVTIFAFRKLLLSDKGDYIFLDYKILWHIEWLKQHGYSDKYERARIFVEKVITQTNKIYSSGYSSLFSLDNTAMPS